MSSDLTDVHKTKDKEVGETEVGTAVGEVAEHRMRS